MVTSTNLTSVGYILETVPGETPATPAWQLLPVTGNELQGNISTETSAVLRTDRQIDDTIPVDSNIEGSIPFEVSYAPWKTLLASLVATGDPDSYSFRKKISVPGESDSYFYYRGCQISSAEFSFQTASILSASLGIVGFTEEPTATAVSGETEVAIPAYSIMNSVTSITTLDVTGLPVGTEIESIDVNVDNNVTPAKAIGTLGAVDLAQFTMDVTGNINVYFENTTIFQNFQNNQSFAINIIVTDADGNTIEIDMPKCKFESLQSPVPGKDEFFFAGGTYRALRDETEGYTIKFTFTDA